MAAGLNWYKADLRELSFLLFEQFRLGELLGKAPYEAWGEDEAKAVLDAAYRFAREVLGPLNAAGDREGCRLEDGQVRTPTGFKEAWKKLYEAGFKALGVATEHGGQGAPQALVVLVEEMLSGANPAFNMYPGLAFGAAEVIVEFGTAGADASATPRRCSTARGAARCASPSRTPAPTSARRRPRAKQAGDGTYAIKGTKIFISGGDHDLAENIIHLVLARVDGAPAGHQGPVAVHRAEDAHRRRRHGRRERTTSPSAPSSTRWASTARPPACSTSARTTAASASWSARVENQGMSQMFQMMNGARIAVGIQGLASRRPRT